MSVEPQGGADYIGICETCGMPIYRPGQACPALDAGVCRP
jgi:hypothetical protein